MTDAARRYQSKRLMAVTIQGITNLNYGFYTNITDAESTELGQVAATGTAGFIANLVLGANTPKPARASKPGVTSSFVAAGSIATAQANGWNIKQAKLGTGGIRARSTIVYVDIGTIRYAWPMPNSQLTAPAMANALDALGINVSTANDRTLIFGCRYPKPPKAKFVEVVGEEVNTYSTFVSPARLDQLPAGWGVSDAGNYPVA